MNEEELKKILRECFKTAKREEELGKKHKGLLVAIPDIEAAKEYIKKAKTDLELCEIYKQKGLDYKIAEEWFYALYYCALAILAKFGVESRSQRYTALFIEYVQVKSLINYDQKFIEKITVHLEKDKKSEVDEREESRYGPKIKIEKIENRYNEMMDVCNSAISQAEEIVFSNKDFTIPQELLL